MKPLSASLSSKDEAYLMKLAKENGLTRGDSENVYSPGYAMKELVRFCREQDIDLRKQYVEKPDHQTKMLEQVHMAIPHLLYLLRMVVGAVDKDLDEKTYQQLKALSLTFLTETCGDFQSVRYQENAIKINQHGINRMPIQEEDSRWR